MKNSILLKGMFWVLVSVLISLGCNIGGDEIESIELRCETTTILVDESTYCEVYGRRKDGNEESGFGKNSTFTSSNEDIAFFNNSGWINGRSTGSVTITANYNGLTDSESITVTDGTGGGTGDDPGTAVTLADVAFPAVNSATVRVVPAPAFLVDQGVTDNTDFTYTVRTFMTDGSSGIFSFENTALGYGNAFVYFEFLGATVAGLQAVDGTNVRYQWNSPGGQTFFSDSTCSIEITSTTLSSTPLPGESIQGQADCAVSSGGYSFRVLTKFSYTE